MLALARYSRRRNTRNLAILHDSKVYLPRGFPRGDNTLAALHNRRAAHRARPDFPWIGINASKPLPPIRRHDENLIPVHHLRGPAIQNVKRATRVRERLEPATTASARR